MSNAPASLPSLIVNRSFIKEFITADTPCFALGLVEEENRQCGFLGLRPNETIPEEVSGSGFKFGNCLLGNDSYEVLHFSFEFYGFETYNVLLNPNNPLVQAVLKTMIEGGDYFFLALDSNNSRATAFRADIEQQILIHLEANLSRLQNSTTTEQQYLQAQWRFSQNPEPQGKLLNWVCRDNLEYLDLTKDRMALTPA